MEFQEGGGRLELALLLVAALGLDFAELVHSILELAGEPLVVQAESGQLRNQGLGTGVLRKQRGFKEWNASESPGGVGEFLGELGFGGSGGLVFVEELAAVKLIGSGVLSSEDGGAAGCRLLVAGCWLWLRIGVGIGFVIRRPPVRLLHGRMAILRATLRKLMGRRQRLT